MSDFPALNAISDAPDQGAAKTQFELFVAATKELLGAQDESELTISAGSVVPDRGVHSIDTQLDAASDDLSNITTTNHPKGRVIIIHANNDARTVVVKHAATGAGQIFLADDADFSLDQTDKWLMLKRTGADWEEIFRSYGNDQAAGRTFLGLNNIANENLLNNGDFRIWQRGNGPFVINTNNTFSADRWVHKVVGAGVGNITKDTDVPADLTGHSMKFDVTGADASLAATDLYAIEQRIEGLNLQDLAFGTAAAKSLTVSFRVKAAKTGVHCVALCNSGLNRSQVKEFTIVAANTWETHSVTFLGDTTGTWLVDSGIGLRLRIALAAGSNFHGTAGTWATADHYATAACVNELDNTANNFLLRDVKVEVGAVATTFESNSIQDELDLCKRYFERVEGANRGLGAGYAAQTTDSRNILNFKEKRVVPTVTASASNIVTVNHKLTTAVSSSLTFNPITKHSCQLQVTTTGLAIGEGNLAFIINSATANIDIDAEL